MTAIETLTGPQKAAMRLGIGLAALDNAESLGWATCPIALVAAGHLSIGGSLSLIGGTITADRPLVNGSQTWNNAAVTFTGLKHNITDTASNAASLLMDLQMGGVSQFSVGKNGYARTRVGMYFGAGDAISTVGGRLDVSIGGSAYVSMLANGIVLCGTSLHFADSNGGKNAGDLVLARDAANTLAQRNGTNPQAFNLYNTYTSGSVYERGFMRWASNRLEIGTEHSGGTLRALKLFGGSNTLELGSAGGTDHTGLFTSTALISGFYVKLGTYIDMTESTPPPAPGTNGGYIYLDDNGSGKTRLMIRFQSGAAQQLAIEA